MQYVMKCMLHFEFIKLEQHIKQNFVSIKYIFNETFFLLSYFVTMQKIVRKLFRKINEEI